MARHSRSPLLVVLAAMLAATGALATLVRQPNPSAVPSGLAVASDAESTALYCTGLTGAHSPTYGHVVFSNISGIERTIAVQVSSNTGQHATRSIQLGAHTSKSIAPSAFVSGTAYGVGAVVDGGGVVAEEVAATSSAQAPCAASGVTDWYGSGFDTLIGSSATLSIYNPTATPAVFDVSTYSSTGFAAPAPFQGFSVGAHDEAVLNLGKEIVNASNIGVHVNVLRGSIAVVGVQQSGPVASFMTGASAPATSAWFPQVSTVRGALAQLRVANPSAARADVTVDVTIGKFRVVPRTFSIPAYESALLSISPNTAIPAVGFASLALHSSEPVVASLATGTTSGVGLSSPATPSRTFLVSDYTGRGFSSATVTNTSSHSVTVTFTRVPMYHSVPATASAQLAPGATRAIVSLFGALTKLHGRTVLVSASRPVIVVATTLPSTPTGVQVVSALNGG
ncbi:MAG TPA: DUF5719 family protein [Acidimicrobiales bacterium]|nr:DUF5719 family protein [Acidimicrobiales bacterium]